MASDDVNLAERSGSLVDAHKGYDPRVIFFYFAVTALFLVLVGGLAWQQLINTPTHQITERVQNQRRILIPGPRGTIYARDGATILVGNKPRFAVLLHLDELRTELLKEHIRIHKNFLAAGDKKDAPTYDQLEKLARVSVAQRYLNQLNQLLHRAEVVDANKLQRHFLSQLLLPYPLLTDLSPEDFAKLIENLPVVGPLEPTTTITRDYPFKSAAAHTLGYVGATDEIEADEDFPGKGLRTFKMKGSVGENGLEQRFDSLLQGEAGGKVFRVDPAGFKVNPPLATVAPVQGKSLVTSIDLDLQLTAEDALADQTGAAVAIEVATGEVLAIASKPDYNLQDFRKPETIADIESRHAWTNLALNGFYPPGSTFKILTSIAALRHGSITPTSVVADCQGRMRIGNAWFVCENTLGNHGKILLSEAIARSCDIYFYQTGLNTTPEVLAAEARRFHLDQRTGIELPGENRRAIIPDPEWKERTQHEKWFPGDTAHMAMGQGFVLVSPLEMACFAASVARGEVFTQPTLVHQANRPPQHTEAIGLTPDQRAAILDGMAGCVTHGTASKLLSLPMYQIPGVRIAGKTGTAQVGVKPHQINIAWFICFAPIENPEIAVAVMIEGETEGETFEGGAHAAPAAAKILKKYFEDKARAGAPVAAPVKTD